MFRIPFTALGALKEFNLFEPGPFSLLGEMLSHACENQTVERDAALGRLHEEPWFESAPPSVDVSLQSCLDLLAHPLIRFTTERVSATGEVIRVITDSDHIAAVSYVADGTTVRISALQSLETVAEGAARAVLAGGTETIRGPSVCVPAAWAGLLTMLYPAAAEGTLTVAVLQHASEQAGQEVTAEVAGAALHELTEAGWLCPVARGGVPVFKIAEEARAKYGAVVPFERIELRVARLCGDAALPTVHRFHRHDSHVWRVFHATQDGDGALGTGPGPLINYEPYSEDAVRDYLDCLLGVQALRADG